MRNEFFIGTVPHAMAHPQGFEKVLFEILVEDRRARVVAAERPRHPVQQHLVKIAACGEFLPEHPQDTLNRPLNCGVPGFHSHLERRGGFVAFDAGVVETTSLEDLFRSA